MSSVHTADARLVTLSQEFEARQAQFKAWDAERDDLPSAHPRAKEIEKLERAVVERGRVIREEVFKLEAHTPEGMQAKARMVLQDLEEEAGHGSQYCNHNLLAAVSLARDVLRRPDAELIAACAEFDALERQRAGVFHGPDAIADETARITLFAFIQEMQEPILDRVYSLRATTLEGYFARARTVLLEDLELHPAEMVASGSTNERLLGALLRDLTEQNGMGSAV
jgi:hypothetical protein